MRVPTDLKLRVGMLEVRRSLGVHTFSRARPLALKYAARVMEVFEMVREQEFTKADIRRLIAGCFADLARDADRGFVSEPGAAEEDANEQRGIVEELAAEAHRQIAGQSFDGRIHHRARALLQGAGYALDELPGALQQDVLSGVARAFLESYRLFLFRLDDRLLPYAPSDPLFVGEVNCISRPQSLPVFDEGARPDKPIGPTLRELVDRYLTARAPAWTAKTARSRATQLGFLVEHLGPDRRIVLITPADAAPPASPAANPGRGRQAE